jgi:hypothetical protein
MILKSKKSKVNFKLPTISKVHKVPKITSVVTFTSEYKFFLKFFISCLKFQQGILLYYDPSETLISKITLDEILNKFCHIFTQYNLNVQFLVDFIPGFISNSFNNPTFIVDRPDFEIFIFLNYNPKNYKHVLLINDVSTFRYEYIIFSPEQLDDFKLHPYSFVCADLNELVLLQMFMHTVETYFKITENEVLLYNNHNDLCSVILFSIFYLKKNFNKIQNIKILPTDLIDKLRPIFNNLNKKYKLYFYKAKFFNKIKLLRLFYYYFYLYVYNKII